MKIYLQDCKTLKFIRCDSSWTSEFAEALDFISVHRATVYGLTELKDAFQLVQVEAGGPQSRRSTIVRLLPVIKMIPATRPARAGRMLCVARQIIRWIRPPQNLRPASRMLSPISVHAEAA
ncbi:MAG TPA: hypothetical protein VG347_15885 [Verrucomicrobiae bacterium]|nr:hypothetical protein [Verrucomicrobiae bacterium]